MKHKGIIEGNFTSTYKQIAGNSLQFENICETTSTLSEGEGSRYNLKLWDIELLTTYLPSIIESAHTMTFNSKGEAEKYYQNPQHLSKAYYSTTDYWYLILAMNGYTSRFDFKDFTGSILVPDSDFVSTLITKIERNRDKK